MSFELARMRFLGESDNGEFGGRVFVYTPTTDTLTTVIAADFFLTYAKELNVGDLIIVNHGSGFTTIKVATATDAGVTVAAGRDGLVSIQSLSGAGAADILSEITEVTSTGADAVTLADGAYIGQKKTVILIVDGGTMTLTPANALGFTNIAFADAGDSVQLEWHSGGWALIGQGGLTTGPLSA